MYDLIIAIAPLVLGGLLAGGGALLGGGLNLLGQRGANATNMKLAQQGQQFELDMWNRNNEYNSPTAQMQRLKDAGLNPNLIYGGGSASTGLSSSYPKAHVATVQNELEGLGSGVSNALSAFMDFKLKSAQIDAVNNNADYVLQKTANEAIRGDLMSKQIVGQDYANQKMAKLLPYSSDAMQANIEKLRLGNRDMLYKLEQMNPESLQNLSLRNKDLKYKLQMINPLTASNLDFRNKLAIQTLTALNPQLMNLRMLESSMKKLDLDFESSLRPYNLKGSDSYPYRFIAKGLQEVLNSFGEDSWLLGGDYDKNGKRVTKYRKNENTW